MITKRNFSVNDLKASESKMSIKQKVAAIDSESDEDSYHTTMDDFMKEYEVWQEV